MLDNIQIPDFSGRILVGDTETTGFKVEEGDRLIEIAFIEIENKVRTGRKLHIYVDPGREVDEGAEKIHGWDRESLILESGGKRFMHVAQEISEFVSGAMVVFHNAPFDVSFLDYELDLAGLPKLSSTCKVYDTLTMARKLYPGKRNTLDALCNRLGVDSSSRDLHGALIDSDILIDVFLSLSATQENMARMFSSEADGVDAFYGDLNDIVEFLPTPLDLPVISLSNEEVASHNAFAEKHLQG